MGDNVATSINDSVAKSGNINATRGNRLVSSAANKSNGAALATKKSQRREARFRENYDRISAALMAKDSKANRNPTRILPDVPGFEIVNKSEISRDFKDVERFAHFEEPADAEKNKEGSDANNHVTLDNGVEMSVTRSLKPLCEKESSLIRKKRRLVHWASTEDGVVDDEIGIWHYNAAKSEEAYKSFEDHVEDWYQSLQDSRALLNNGIRMCHESNKRLKTDSKTLYDLCEQECGLTSRKRRNLNVRDMIEEMHERRLLIEEQLMEEFEELAAMANKEEEATGATNSICPIVSLKLRCSDFNLCEQDTSTGRKATELSKFESSDRWTAQYRDDTNFTHLPSAKNYVTAASADKLFLPYFDSEQPHQEQSAAVKTATAAALLEKKTASECDFQKIVSTAGDEEMNEMISHPLDVSIGGAMNIDENLATVSVTEEGNNYTCEMKLGSETTQAAVNVMEAVGVADLCAVAVRMEEELQTGDLCAVDTEFTFQSSATDRSLSLQAFERYLHTRSEYACSTGSTTNEQDDFDSFLAFAKVQNELGRQEGERLSALLVADIFRKVDTAAHAQFSATRVKRRSQSHQLPHLSSSISGNGPSSSKVDQENLLVACADVRLRYPRGVALLLSPLSQYEDRVLGTLKTATQYRNLSSDATGCTEQACYRYEIAYLPPSVHAAENEAMERCRLQSSAAAANQKLKQLRNRGRELSKMVHESESSQHKSNAMFLQVRDEDEAERQRIFEDLFNHNLLSKAQASSSARAEDLHGFDAASANTGPAAEKRLKK